ncbi:Hypothetical protein [Corynebacterium glutamicum ATCC 13032]|uniref:Uncharacterized protein n=1 Tax=Corynebacterium glutamicum (strain ATCC 13032 / DSM 20300 / JCM 1318 / BCRC 11384 / CCUG 27702 / LMG 3730 / NBRC 12168 / NCIMB 10025 / NRRL B-2784 / 534) TaxID=196627 RepID=Q8NPQ9_CORGL|nr:Hypothetical protein [Corynebacterium glutamicum ATCC 13032]
MCLERRCSHQRDIFWLGYYSLQCNMSWWNIPDQGCTGEQGILIELRDDFTRVMIASIKTPSREITEIPAVEICLRNQPATDGAQRASNSGGAFFVVMGGIGVEGEEYDKWLGGHSWFSFQSVCRNAQQPSNMMLLGCCGVRIGGFV